MKPDLKPDALPTFGVATLHYGYNEGAILQAYALTTLIERYLGPCRAEVLDQRYPGKAGIYGPPSNARQRALLEAIEQWLPLSPPFRSASGEQALAYAGGAYRALFVGSDVTWALRYTGRLRRLFARGVFPRQVDPFFPAFPNVYWPDGQFGAPRFSYAASVGSLDWRTIPSRDRRAMRETLEGFAGLSVRDERSLLFLEWLSPALAERARLVPDPTLPSALPDPALQDDLRGRLERAGVDFSRPRLGVVCSDLPAMAEAADRLRQDGYQIVGISTPNAFSDVALFERPIAPAEWAALFGLMDACVVDRMHASIFCLKNRTPFVALDSYETDLANDSKTRSLLRRYGREPYCLPKSTASAGDILERVRSLEGGGSMEQVEQALATDVETADAFFASVRETLAG